MKKRIAILGSTGSIGVSTLDVVARHPEQFQVMGLVAGKNILRLASQIKQFSPSMVVLKEERDIPRLREALDGDWKGETLAGEESACSLVEGSEIDLVVSAIVGVAGLRPTYAALKKGKQVALANKESLVAAGPVMTAALSKPDQLIPVDSEHSAIFQVLQGQATRSVRKITLTASGGPLKGFSKEELKKVTVEVALKHPNWAMGDKITIDSATMMNKGLEMIEAKWLFGLKPEQIDVRVHPQSIIHSLVEFQDGSWLAQLGLPDMRTPIAYALAYPDRIESGVPPMELTNVSPLTFEHPDEVRFPCLRLAREALQGPESVPCVLNAANEVAVEAFLQKKISFIDIAVIVEKTLQMHFATSLGTASRGTQSLRSIDDVLELDAWARGCARKEITC